MLNFPMLLDRFDPNNTDAVVAAINNVLTSSSVHTDATMDETLLELAIALASRNIAAGTGGPFGAVLADLSGAAPKIVGLGANSVTSRADPSAHAEIEAVRDAANRLGYSDLSGLTLFSSCECCPMCLAVANGSGISRIAYAATRGEAASAGFSDELQYRLCQLDDAALSTHITHDARDGLLERLQDHGAMVLGPAGEVLGYGEADTGRDPSSLATVQAIRGALKQMNAFWLPEGCTLVSYLQPHLAGLMLADWARLLRPRSMAYADDPAHDLPAPDPLRVCYLNDSPEQMIVRDAQGQDAIAQDALITREQPTLPDARRAIPTARGGSERLRSTACEVFDRWVQGIADGTHSRY